MAQISIWSWNLIFVACEQGCFLALQNKVLVLSNGRQGKNLTGDSSINKRNKRSQPIPCNVDILCAINQNVWNVPGKRPREIGDDAEHLGGIRVALFTRSRGNWSTIFTLINPPSLSRIQPWAEPSRKFLYNDIYSEKCVPLLRWHDVGQTSAAAARPAEEDATSIRASVPTTC